MSNRSFDAVIVGGGIVGTTAAWSLARRGAKIALVESETVGSGTTSRTFAWINATSKVGDEAYHRLNALGGRLYRELGDHFSDERLGLRRSGMLQIVRASDEANHAATLEQVRHLEAYGYPPRMIDRGELARPEPAAVLADDAVGLHATVDDWLDAPRFARALADDLVAGGHAVMEHCAARELHLDDSGAVAGLVTADGVLETGHVLLAAGPDTNAVLAGLTGFAPFENRFPMRRVPGLLLDTPYDPAAAPLHHVVYAEVDAGEFHIRPTPDGGLRMGSDNIDGLIAEDSSEAEIRAAAEKLLAMARDLAPDAVGQPELDACRLAIGVRPYPHDGKSLAGAVPGAPGLSLIATHSGVTLAPAIGRLMAELILDGRTNPALAPFSLDRIPGFAAR